MAKYDGIERRAECEGCVHMERAVNMKADELYESIGKRPTWTFYIVFASIFLAIAGSSFLYTTMSIEALEKRHIREIERHDKVIERMDAKLDKILEKMDKQ